MNTVVVLFALFAAASAAALNEPKADNWNTEQKPMQWNGQHWTQWNDESQQWNTVPVTKSAANWNTEHQWNKQQQPAHVNSNWNNNWNTNTGSGHQQSRALWTQPAGHQTNAGLSQAWNGHQWNTAVPVARSGSWSSGTPSHTWTNNWNNWNTVPVARSAWSSQQPSTWTWNTVPAWNGWNTYSSSWPWTYYVAA